MHDNAREFVRLAREVRRICETDATWETKYELVFTENVSLRLQKLMHFDWCDPDTSYEEDVLAFSRAVNEQADDIERALGTSPDV